MNPAVVETVGTLAAVLGTVCWLPQSIKTIRTKNTKDLSLWSNILLLATVLLWLAYGIALGAWPLIAANTISSILVSIIVFMKLRYG